MREAVALQRAEFVGNLRSVRQPGPEQPRRIDKLADPCNAAFFRRGRGFRNRDRPAGELDRLISDEERGVRFVRKC